ncbi:MAG: plasmid recombination protein [Acidobacteria bacterium]|nr:plasmid recombination protein [Acidobacteriota bacterium]
MARVAGFFKVLGRKKITTSHRSHLEGQEDSRPDHALARDGIDRSIDLGAEPERAALLTAECLANRGRGRPPLQRVEALFAGPPPFHEPNAWPTERITDWARASTEWLRSTLPPGTPLEVAHLHTDETSPHVHVAWPTAAPRADGKLRLSWKDQQAQMAERAAGRSVRGSSAQMQALQDSYYRDVSERFGLERGKRGAGIKYDPTADSAKGARDRAAAAEARAALAEAAAAEASHRADLAEGRADLAEQEQRRTDEQLHDERQRRADADQRALVAEQRQQQTAGRLLSDRQRRSTTERKSRRQAVEARRQVVEARRQVDTERQAHDRTAERLDDKTADEHARRHAAAAGQRRQQAVEARAARGQRRPTATRPTDRPAGPTARPAPVPFPRPIPAAADRKDAQWTPTRP